jgi:voltage-gated potassium channel
VFRILETATDDDLSSRIVDIFLVVLISLSVLAVIFESIPSFELRYSTPLAVFETFTVAVFSVEYLLRLWSSVESSAEARRQPIVARLRHIISFHAIIDLLAILPFYLLAFGAFGGADMRILRAVRLLRVLKLTRYFAALNLLFTTIRENSKALGAAFLILITIMLLAASGMYYFERDAQPIDFGSIPAAMWWAFATLTTVGYGDVTPITVGGKIFGALIAVVGIGMVALPTSILASGYTRQLEQSTSDYMADAEQALDDGIIDEDEERYLESRRIDLGLSRHRASQILDAGRVKLALMQAASEASLCPHCQQPMPRTG